MSELAPAAPRAQFAARLHQNIRVTAPFELLRHLVNRPADGDAIQATGAKNMPDSGRPEHALPFTPAGLKANLANKPAWGPRMVPSALSNDPQPTCEPQGWPRIILHNYRTTQILQTPKQVLILYQFNRKWRNIWTDGRSNPKVDDLLEPRWWGYSVGRWVDDYTFVAETVGLDERTWLDNAGNPHSASLRVVERYHRVGNRIEGEITLYDPEVLLRPVPARVPYATPDPADVLA